MPVAVSEAREAEVEPVGIEYSGPSSKDADQCLMALVNHARAVMLGGSPESFQVLCPR